MSRCEEVSIVRHHVKPGGAPPGISQPLGARLGRESDYALRCMSRRHTFSMRVRCLLGHGRKFKDFPEEDQTRRGLGDRSPRKCTPSPQTRSGVGFRPPARARVGREGARGLLVRGKYITPNIRGPTARDTNSPSLPRKQAAALAFSELPTS
jgi:hypothetical protein